MQEVAIDVSSKDGSFRITIDSAFIVPAEKFNMPSQMRPASHEDSEIYTHLDGIELESVSPDDITILIGANAPEALVTTDIRRGNKDQPLAVNTKFGWTLFGSSTPVNSKSNYQSNVSLLQTSANGSVGYDLRNLWSRNPSIRVNTVFSTSDLNLEESLEKFWKQEHCAILPVKDTAMAAEDREAMKVLQQRTS